MTPLSSFVGSTLQWKHLVTGQLYKWAPPQSSILFIKVSGDEPILWGLIHRASHSLINTQPKVTLHCCCLPARQNAKALALVVTKTYYIFTVSGILVYMCLFTLKYVFVQMLIIVFGPCLTWESWCLFCSYSLCGWVLLRDIISSNVHLPDSLPILCVFGYIGVFEDSPGETESLCKHNQHDNVNVLFTPGLIRVTVKRTCSHTVF